MFSRSAFSATAFAIGGAGAFAGAAFSGLAFSTGVASAPVPYSITLPVDIDFADARVFDSAIGRVKWSIVVVVGGVDLSGLLVGDLQIQAAEDAARVATMSMAPVSSAQLESLDSAAVSIDVIVSGGGYSARRRRFTGVVERVVFSMATRVAEITCRDGYQERINACISGEQVVALVGDMAVVSPLVAPWNTDEPDPSEYFNSVMATAAGSTFIDGAGVWRAHRWAIGAASLVFTAADMFDPGPVLDRPARADMPRAVTATLTHSFHRLHSASLLMYWVALPRQSYQLPVEGKGIRRPSRDQWQSALEGVGDWYVAAAEYSNFESISYSGTLPPPAEVRATMYRRWYQQVTRRYTVTIEMGGSSSRTELINRSVRSDFDASAWESGASANTSVDIYRANAPYGTPEPSPIGISALPPPWPPGNGAMDHYGFADADILGAIRHVVAEAARTVAQGRRQQRVSFSRPADLRLDIGVVAGIDAYGLMATGQLQSWEETYSIETGGCVGMYVFSCPDGDAAVTASSVILMQPSVGVVHDLPPPNLQNWIGAATTTPDYLIDPLTISGALGNVDAAADEYSATKPVYEDQVRIVMPSIPAIVRDPVEDVVAVTAVINVAGSGVDLAF